MKEIIDAVVVGAGYAGLAAARKLTEEGYSTVVLEAHDRVGGRAYTVEEAGARVDLGGQWIGPGQDHIYALAAETGVATFAQWTAGEDVVLENGRPLRVSCRSGRAPGAEHETAALRRMGKRWRRCWFSTNPAATRAPIACRRNPCGDVGRTVTNASELPAGRFQPLESSWQWGNAGASVVEARTDATEDKVMPASQLTGQSVFAGRDNLLSYAVPAA
jgi:hypothetical protein